MASIAILLPLALASAPTAADAPTRDGPAPGVGTPSERFAAEAPRALEQLEAKCAGLRWAGVETHTRESQAEKGPKSSRSLTSIEFRQQGRDRLVSIHQPLLSIDSTRPLDSSAPNPTDGHALVYGSNPSYAFVLERKTRRDPYLVRVRHAMPTNLPGNLSNDRAHTARLLCGGPLTTRSLREALKHPAFQVRRLVDVEEGGRPLLRLEFDFDAGLQDHLSYRDWHVVLDPGAHWTVREIQNNIHNKVLGKSFVMNWKCDFEVGDDGFPALRRSERSITAEDGSYIDRNVLEIQEWSYVEAPDADFTLAAFGFDEGGRD